MNRLPIEKRCKIIHLLVEGNSLSSTARIMDVSFNTVMKLFIEVGKACIRFHNQHVKNIKSQRVQLDEVWSFVHCKKKNAPEESVGIGDIWTFVGMDSDTKLILSWLVGTRNMDTACYFVNDVVARLEGRVQISTDGYKPYIKAIDNVLDDGVQIDYGQLVKIYGKPGYDNHEDNENKKGNYKYAGSRKDTIFGEPNHKFTSTSNVERQNLTMRMGMRRLTRKTNAFSKKLENHFYAHAIHYVHYNFIRIHKTLCITPAMQAGLMKKPMTIQDILLIAD